MDYGMVWNIPYLDTGMLRGYFMEKQE